MADEIKFAQDAPYKNTKVTVAQSRRSIIALLRNAGVKRFIVDEEIDSIEFQWGTRWFKFDRQPLPIRLQAGDWRYRPKAIRENTDPTAKQVEQAKKQAMRALFHHVKTTLESLFWESAEHMMMPYMMIDEVHTVRDVPIESMAKALPPPVIEVEDPDAE